MVSNRGGGGYGPPAAAAPPAPAAYQLDFTTYGSNESPLSAGGVWTNASTGTGGNAALAPNNSMQIRMSADSSTRICAETGQTNDYDDSLGGLPGFPGNQRVQATVYKQSGYSPGANHELLLGLGLVVRGTNDKRCIHFGFNYAGGYFVAGFDGDLVSWDAPPTGVLSSPWYSAATGSGSAPVDGDVMRAELNRSAKTAKMWQNSTLVIDLQWNDTTHVNSTAQAALNSLGSSIYIGALARIGATAGAFGWRSVLVSETLLG